jgi:hypothetical protein
MPFWGFLFSYLYITFLNLISTHQSIILFVCTDELIKYSLQIIDIMGDKVGVPIEVLVKRANNVSVTLTVIPEEADASR